MRCSVNKQRHIRKSKSPIQECTEDKTWKKNKMGSINESRSNDIASSEKKINLKSTDSDNEEESKSKEWREYFTKKELLLAYNQIDLGIDPDDIIEENESNSDLSEDDLEPAEMNDFIASLNVNSYIRIEY